MLSLILNTIEEIITTEKMVTQKVTVTVKVTVNQQKIIDAIKAKNISIRQNLSQELFIIFIQIKGENYE